MVTLAFIGGAHIHAPNFIKRLNESKLAQVKSFWDWQPERAAKNAALLPGCEVELDLARICADPTIQGAIVCTETNRHREVVLPLAAAGKALFVEKPLGFASADAFAMAKAIEKAGVLFQTGYFMRSDANLRYLRYLVGAEAFGHINRVRASNCHTGSLGGWFDTDWRWMADPAQAGCGAFGDLGTHSLDLLLWMFGTVEAATGLIQPVTRRYGDCDETGEALLRFSNGIYGTLAAGWTDLDNAVTFQISGTAGAARIVQGQLYLRSKEWGDGKTPFTSPEPALPHAFELFVRALAGEPVGEHLVTPSEAAERNAVMEAIYDGARTGTFRRPALLC